MLEPPAGEEAEIIRRREALVDFRELLGTRGTTTTQLTPSGKARFGDQLVDVIADGEVIDRGATVESRRGSRQPRAGSGKSGVTRSCRVSAGSRLAVSRTTMFTDAKKHTYCLAAPNA